MKRLEQDGCVFISLNPAEHVAVTLPGSMLDHINVAGVAKEDQFVFFANAEGSLLRIKKGEYEILKSFPPQSAFDEQLKKLVSEYYLTRG